MVEHWTTNIYHKWSDLDSTTFTSASRNHENKIHKLNILLNHKYIALRYMVGTKIRYMNEK